jgi:hypothetical protein
VSITLTIDVFSGRPNPTVVVKGREELQLLERLRPDGDAESEAAAPFSETALGYRGILVKIEGRRPRGLPAAFRVVKGLGLMAERSPFVIADPGFEDYVCSADGPLHPLFRADPGLPKLLREERERWHEQWVIWRPPLEPGAWSLSLTCPKAPMYEPSVWNAVYAIRSANNCYNYATNTRTDTFAQPGRAAQTNKEFKRSEICRERIEKEARKNGLVDSPRVNKCPAEGHLVALLVWHQADYHWLRKGRNGFWSHKMSAGPATNVDDLSAFIFDPRDARIGSYKFCLSMIAKHGHFRIW